MRKKCLLPLGFLFVCLLLSGCGGGPDPASITTDEIINGTRDIWLKVSQEQRIAACESILEQVSQTDRDPEELATCVNEALDREPMTKVVKVAANCLL